MADSASVLWVAMGVAARDGETGWPSRALAIQDLRHEEAMSGHRLATVTFQLVVEASIDGESGTQPVFAWSSMGH